MSNEEARRPKCGVKWFLLMLIFLCLIIDGYRMDLDIHHWDCVYVCLLLVWYEWMGMACRACSGSGSGYTIQ